MQVSTQTLVALHNLSQRLGVHTSIQLSTLSIDMRDGTALQLSANPSAVRHSITWTLRKIDSTYESGMGAARGEGGITFTNMGVKVGARREKKPLIVKKGRVVWEKSLGVLDMFSLRKIIVKVVQKLKESPVVGLEIPKP